jgi:hypothetical protein
MFLPKFEITSSKEYYLPFNGFDQKWSHLATIKYGKRTFMYFRHNIGAFMTYIEEITDGWLDPKRIEDGKLWQELLDFLGTKKLTQIGIPEGFKSEKVKIKPKL